MPLPLPRQATFAAGVNVSPSLACIRLARLKSAVRGDDSRRRARVLLRRSSTKGTAAPLVLGTGGGGACHAEEVLSASRLGTPGECVSRSTFALDRPCSEV